MLPRVSKNDEKCTFKYDTQNDVNFLYYNKILGIVRAVIQRVGYSVYSGSANEFAIFIG